MDYVSGVNIVHGVVVKPSHPPRLTAVKEGIQSARDRIIEIITELSMLADGLSGPRPPEVDDRAKPPIDVNRGVIGEIEDEMCRLHNTLSELAATKSRLIALHG